MEDAILIFDFQNFCIDEADNKCYTVHITDFCPTAANFLENVDNYRTILEEFVTARSKILMEIFSSIPSRKKFVTKINHNFLRRKENTPTSTDQILLGYELKKYVCSGILILAQMFLSNVSLLQYDTWNNKFVQDFNEYYKHIHPFFHFVLYQYIIMGQPVIFSNDQKEKTPLLEENESIIQEENQVDGETPPDSVG